MRKMIWKMLFSVIACTIVIMESSNIVMAAEFDPNYCANRYPDVVSVLGTSTDALYQHYLIYGMNEGRYPYKRAMPGEKVDGVNRTVTVAIGSETTGFTPVAIDK